MRSVAGVVAVAGVVCYNIRVLTWNVADTGRRAAGR